jgi:hypothetical protein
VSLRYEQPHALRRAFEDRLNSQARTSRLPVDRLRKEAAFERLLARIGATAPYGSWALKGGLAMLARVGAHARATADADTTWRGTADRLTATLEHATGIDLADHFQFLIGSPHPLRGEGPDGGLRFPIESRLAGRRFESIRLDINISPNDPRPVEQLRLRNHLAFAGLPDVVVPAITAAQQLAEKLHAYTRDYGTNNTRAKDLYDMLIIAADLPVPPLGELLNTCTTTFALRHTPWPPRLGAPPKTWTVPWAGFVRDYAITYTTLDGAYTALTAFWEQVLSISDPSLAWQPATWTWTAT